MFINVIQDAFNYALNQRRKEEKVCPYTLCPNFYKKAENYLKMRLDGRCSLFILAESNCSCLVKYKNMKYWLNYNFTKETYEIEKYESWRG